MTTCPQCQSEQVMSDTPLRGVCNDCGWAWDNRTETNKGVNCSNCDAEIVAPLLIAHPDADWVCLECSGASLSDFVDEAYVCES